MKIEVKQKQKYRPTPKLFSKGVKCKKSVVQYHAQCKKVSDKLDGGGFTFNDSGASVDFRAETNTLTHAMFIDGSADKIGFGTSAPTSGFVNIDQASSTGAIAVLTLDQGDGDRAI